MTCLHIRCGRPISRFTWDDPWEYPLPTAFRKLLLPPTEGSEA